MNESAATHTGPLGSTVHVLRADADTVAPLAAIEWSRFFRRVCLDPVRRVVTLMPPSPPHEDLTGMLDRVVDAAASVLAGAARGIRDSRLRGPGEPPGTGMEPDCAFYAGGRARAFRAALIEGEDAASAFIERTAPDLVGGGRDHPRRHGQDRTLRRSRGAGALAAARLPGFMGAAGGFSRPSSR